MAIKFLDDEAQPSSSTIKFTGEPSKPSIVFTDTAQPLAAAPKPPEDLTKPAFLAPRQRATVLQERAANIRKEEEQKIPFDALWKDDKNFKTIQDYASARFGKEGVLLAGETKEQFVNYRNEWFTKEIEFLGSSGAKGSAFQRSRNDIRAAFNSYQMQSARDEGFGGLKTHDEDKIDSKESMILIRYVCWRAKLNCIWLEDDSVARPFQQDPRLWSYDQPVFFWDRKRRAMGIPVSNVSWLSTWLSNWETAGKKFIFPDADGKKSDILEKWKQFTAYKSTDDKLKKEELAQLVGRAEVIGYFNTLANMT